LKRLSIGVALAAKLKIHEKQPQHHISQQLFACYSLGNINAKDRQDDDKSTYVRTFVFLW
jgi:hypothetical protein